MTSADRAVAGESEWRGDELAEALLDARGVVPERDVSWDHFHRLLAARAALRLARLRSGGRVTRLSRLAVTASATASFAATTATRVLGDVLRRFGERTVIDPHHPGDPGNRDA